MNMLYEKNREGGQNMMEDTFDIKEVRLAEDEVREWRIETKDNAILGASCGCRCRAVI